MQELDEPIDAMPLFAEDVICDFFRDQIQALQARKATLEEQLAVAQSQQRVLQQRFDDAQALLAKQNGSVLDNARLQVDTAQKNLYSVQMRCVELQKKLRRIGIEEVPTDLPSFDALKQRLRQEAEASIASAEQQREQRELAFATLHNTKEQLEALGEELRHLRASASNIPRHLHQIRVEIARSCGLSLEESVNMLQLQQNEAAAKSQHLEARERRASAIAELAEDLEQRDWELYDLALAEQDVISAQNYVAELEKDSKFKEAASRRDKARERLDQGTKALEDIRVELRSCSDALVRAQEELGNHVGTREGYIAEGRQMAPATASKLRQRCQHQDRHFPGDAVAVYQVTNRVKDSLLQQRNSEISGQQAVVRKSESIMGEFCRDWPAETANLTSDFADRDAFISRYRQIKATRRPSLPALRRRPSGAHLRHRCVGRGLRQIRPPLRPRGAGHLPGIPFPYGAGHSQ